jgi:hypothetical protein
MMFHMYGQRDFCPCSGGAAIKWGAMRRAAMPHFQVIVGGSLLLSSGTASLTPSSCAPARRVPPLQDQDDSLTRFQLITGDPDSKVWDHLALPQPSPIVAYWALWIGIWTRNLRPQLLLCVVRWWVHYYMPLAARPYLNSPYWRSCFSSTPKHCPRKSLVEAKALASTDDSTTIYS